MKTLGEAQEMIAALKTDLEYAENERRKLAEQVRTAEEEYKSLESDFNHIDRLLEKETNRVTEEIVKKNYWKDLALQEMQAYKQLERQYKGLLISYRKLADKE